MEDAISVPVGYPTSTIFIDESRARVAGGRFFAVAAVKLRKPGAAARRLQSIRDDTNFIDGEFKFKDVTTGSLHVYEKALRLLDDGEVQIHATVVDSQFYDPFKTDPFWKVHADIVTQLLVGAINKRELVTVVVDRISPPKHYFYEDRVKERVNRRLKALCVVGCIMADSRCNDLLQIADLVAGSIAYDRAAAAATYRPKTTEKKKVVAYLKAALDGAELADGRTGRVNIATYRAPRSRPSGSTTLRVLPRQKAG